MTDSARRRIVVGVDGSAGSEAAAAWAAAEGAVRDVPVDLVHVWSTPMVYSPMGLGAIAIDPAEYEQSAKEVLEGIVARVAAGAPEGVDLRSVLAEGHPVTVLLDHARDADLVVVGSRGLGGFRGLLLGSVSQQVVHHAPCPVVIVPVPEEHADRA